MRVFSVKQMAVYESAACLVGSVMCIRDSLSADRPTLAVVRPSESEIQRHNDKLTAIAGKNGEPTVWQGLTEDDTPLQ